MATRRIIDVQDGDQQFVSESVDDIRLLVGCLKEMFEEKKELLLSPVFRDLVLQKAKQVERRMDVLRNIICADNLGKPLGEQFKERGGTQDGIVLS